MKLKKLYKKKLIMNVKADVSAIDEIMKLDTDPKFIASAKMAKAFIQLRPMFAMTFATQKERYFFTVQNTKIVKPRSRRYIADEKRDYKESFQMHINEELSDIKSVRMNKRKRAYKVNINGYNPGIWKVSLLPPHEFKKILYDQS